MAIIIMERSVQKLQYVHLSANCALLTLPHILTLQHIQRTSGTNNFDSSVKYSSPFIEKIQEK